MKKIIAAIIALVVVFAVALGAESSFSKEKLILSAKQKILNTILKKCIFIIQCKMNLMQRQTCWK